MLLIFDGVIEVQFIDDRSTSGFRLQNPTASIMITAALMLNDTPET